MDSYILTPSTPHLPRGTTAFQGLSIPGQQFQSHLFAYLVPSRRKTSPPHSTIPRPQCHHSHSTSSPPPHTPLLSLGTHLRPIAAPLATRTHGSFNSDISNSGQLGRQTGAKNKYFCLKEIRVVPSECFSTMAVIQSAPS